MTISFPPRYPICSAYARDAECQNRNGLVTLRSLRASAKVTNPYAMIQLLFRSCSRRATRTGLSVSLISAASLCSFYAAEAEEPAVAVTWVAPASQAQKTNPIAADPASIAAGRKIYMQRCAKCHGETGKGDGPDAMELKLHPAKFAGSAIRGEPDGALFWKISVGKKGMPDFGKRLSPTDRWNVINFLRTLGGG